jgi:general secretion pathway protein D
MMKAVTTPLIVSLLLATASALPAQSEVDTAVSEAVRRQADQITLRQTLADARASEQRRDLVTAAKLYDAAWQLVEGIGSGVEPEARQTVIGLTAVRMQLARDAQSAGDLRGADTDVRDVLRVNPGDIAAQQFKAHNDQLLAQQKRYSPSTEALEQVPAIQKDKEAANTLVQDAKLFFELGKYDEADAKLKAALKLDPDNKAAFYYQNLVQQKRFQRGVDERNTTSTTRIVRVEDSWAESHKRDLLPVPNPMARTNLTYTSPARQAIMSKLDSIHLDSIAYEGLPLSEVIRDLSEKAKKRDPEHKGINFLINPQQSAAQSVATTPVVGLGGPGGFTPPPAQPIQPATPAIDPNTGLPIPTQNQPAQQTDINSINVKISPPLTDIRLADALDAIVTVADQPIKYSILDYAVVFSLKGQESAPLTSRRFKVDPNTFIQGLESVGGLDFSSFAGGGVGGGGGAGGGGIGGGGAGGISGGSQSGQGGSGSVVPRVNVVSGSIGGGGAAGGGQGGGQSGAGIIGVTRTNFMASVQSAVIAFFRAEGVNLDPPKSVFFNDREGSLWVRATTEDLDIIEQAIQTLNIAPPQVNIRVKFVEVTQNDTKALGFDWYLGNVLMGGHTIAGSGGTQPSLTGAPTAANPEGTFPGSSLFGTAIAPANSDGLMTSGLRNTVNAPAVGTITGILTDPQFRMVIRALQQRNGVDELTDGQVTTLSGRQTQFQAVDLKYIVVGSGVNQTGAGTSGGVAGGAGVTTGNGAVATAIIPFATPIPLGPTLDVIPYVSADGYTIQMTLIPTLVEFIGYDDPGQFIIQAQSVGGQQGAGAPLTAVLPLPHFRLRQVTTSCIVWDGQTVVLGGLISDNVTRVKDQLPVLGDLPWVGRLFRSEQNQSTKQNLLIFVTPTIIDPAGNRVHTDEDLPFAQNSFPTQKSVVNP